MSYYVVAGTGHRPPKGGLDYFMGESRIAPGNSICWHKIERFFEDHPIGQVGVITGMALGFDMLLARVARQLNIPYTAAVPFIGQESRWPREAQKVYNDLLDDAHKVIVVSEGGYSAKKMQVRNEWMVDHADMLIAWWDGSNGGTANCVRYAQSQDIPILNLLDGRELTR